MTPDVFRFALDQIDTPKGQVLWLYGDADMATGDVYQPRSDKAAGLIAKGCTVFTDIDELGRDYDAVFVAAPRQHLESAGLIALALQRARGFVMAAAGNTAGGKRLSGIMEAFGVQVDSLSKHHGRAVWTRNATGADGDIIARHLENLAPRKIAMDGADWWTVPGLFGWDRIDPGSRLLVANLPADLSGRVADFGCGFGYLSAMAARNCPAIVSIDAFDIDARAADACKRNCGAKITAHWQDLAGFKAPTPFDAVIMNPPFHDGGMETVDLGRALIRAAWNNLRPGGRLYLVANRHLPYEHIQPSLSILFEGEGYKIMSGRKS